MWGRAEGSIVAQQQFSGNQNRGVKYILFIVIVFILFSEFKNIKVYKKCGFLVIIFLKILMSCQEKIQDRLLHKNVAIQGVYLPCLPSSLLFPFSSLAPPSYAMWCTVVIPSTNLLTKRFYIFFMNLLPNVIFVKFICILF